MPYYLDWMDEKRRILKLQLTTPVSASELEDLWLEVMEIYSQPEPLYILADLRQFSWKNAPSFDSFDSTVTPSPQKPPDDFAVALLGTGFVFRLFGLIINNRFLSQLGPPGTQRRARVFEYEDHAYAWLMALADGLPV